LLQALSFWPKTIQVLALQREKTMKIKKSMWSLLSLLAIFALASCGSTAVSVESPSSFNSSAAQISSRNDAIASLAKIDKIVTASSYVMPKEFSVSQTTKTKVGTDEVEKNNYKYVSADEISFSAFEDGTIATSASTGVTKTSGRSTVVAILKAGKLSLSMDAAVGTDTVFSYAVLNAMDEVAVDVVSALKTQLQLETQIITSSPAGMKRYLSAFAPGTGPTALAAGATIGADTYMKEESYSGDGEGDLELKITPHYGKYNYDEGMEYAYTGNRISKSSNSLRGVTTTYSWDTSAVASFSTKGLTDVSADSTQLNLLTTRITGALSSNL